MSKLDDLKGESKLVVIERTHSVQEKTVLYGFKIALLLLCVYVSRNSAWWTLVTGIGFLSFLWSVAMNELNKKGTTFTDKELAKKHIDDMDIFDTPEHD